MLHSFVNHENDCTRFKCRENLGIILIYMTDAFLQFFFLTILKSSEFLQWFLFAYFPATRSEYNYLLLI